MTSAEDPLLALRQAIQAKNAITSSEDVIELSDTLKYAKTTATRYRNAANNAYTLEALYLAWKFRDVPGADYMRQTREQGLTVGFVSITERKGVVDWLEGRIDNSDRIIPLTVESTTPPGTPPQVSQALASIGSSSTNTGLAASSSAAGLGSSSTAKRRYVVDTYDVEVVKKIKQNEIELSDRNTVLRGTKPNNFASIRQVYSDKLRKLKDPGTKTSSTSAAGQNADSSNNNPMNNPSSRKSRNQYPIIMISSSPTALITMYNVKKFLSEAIFEPSTVAKEKINNARPDDMIPLYRKRVTIEPGSGREIETQLRYSVVDGTEALSKFGADAWERVVCVMTTGQVWQFRPYKWNEPRALFHHVKGVYVSWSSDPPNPKIKDWNVEELKVDPHRRHIDKSVVAHFWKSLDSWVLANKPWLMKG